MTDKYDMQNTTAPAVLEAGARHMRDRAATYDKPEGERSMGATVAAFRFVTGVSMTEEQGWLFMALLKADEIAALDRAMMELAGAGAALVAHAKRIWGVE